MKLSKKICPAVLVIAGPTASGKTALSIKLAKKFNGEIISADSRQVYRGLDLGSGKVTKKEMAGIPHHLLDVADPKRKFSVARYQKLALKAIANILKNGKLPIIVGGTGFYIQAVVDGLVLPEVKPNIILRKSLAQKSASQLFAMLKKLDSVRAKNIDSQNPARLIRAIEIAESLGRVPALKKTPPPYNFLQLGIKVKKDDLPDRISKRLTIRLKKGMLAEAKKLRQNGLSFKRMEELGLEYRHEARFLQGKISRAEMIAAIEKDSLDYAKRQMTWLKKDRRIIWISNYREALKALKLEV